MFAAFVASLPGLTCSRYRRRPDPKGKKGISVYTWTFAWLSIAILQIFEFIQQRGVRSSDWKLVLG